MYKILVINPGSTSTKLALYEDETPVFKRNVEHPMEVITSFETIYDQYELRYNTVMSVLEEEKVDLSQLDCIVGRGGPAIQCQAGAYLLNEDLVNRMRYKPINYHVSLLAGIIAYDLGRKLNIPAYIYDAVTTDEFNDLARFSGIKEIPRISAGHVLNSRAVGRKVAKTLGKKYEELNLIIAHLGGGHTVSIHQQGRIVDLISDDEGPFSPERSGGVPCRALVDLCYQNDRSHMHKLLRGKGGLISYLGTSDAREVERRIDNGDEYAALVYEAMAYQIAKAIGSLCPVVDGKVDAVIITGGLARSERLMASIKKRVSYIAPVFISPGEDELEALALGGLRVLRGEEKPHIFQEEEVK